MRNKRIIALVLSVAMLLSVFTFPVQAAETVKFQIVGKTFEYGFDAIAIAIEATTASGITVENLIPGFAGYTEDRTATLAVGAIYENDKAAIDESGDGVPNGGFIIVELGDKYAGNNPEGAGSDYSLLNYSLSTGKNSLAFEGISVTGDDGTVYELDAADPIVYTNTSGFKLFESTATYEDGTNLKYQLYSPDSDSDKLPLVVWLHGMGEGGTGGVDGYNGVTQLLANEGGVGWLNELTTSQALLTTGSALSTSIDFYVAAPQALDAWDWRTEDPKDSARIDQMIKDILEANRNIDPDKIYVAGCSMGGGQTFAQLIYSKTATDAVQFAGAFPICPAYALTPEDAELIKDIPIWIFQSADDTTVNPDYVRQSFNYLLEAGSETAQYTEYENVQGADGQSYNGHWSWVRVLNNEDGVLEWLLGDDKTFEDQEPELVSPTNIAYETDGLTATLTWDEVEGATYVIYQIDSETGEAISIGESEETSFEVTVEEYGTYTFTVTAKKGDKESAINPAKFIEIEFVEEEETTPVVPPTYWPYVPYYPAVTPAAPVIFAVNINFSLQPVVYADALNSLGLLYGV
ncbi:MAG: hypothetical protein LBT59_07300, partial [Clostridiales bacterium]|nr:hypothetical protein [Clostridiales bacterium]